LKSTIFLLIISFSLAIDAGIGVASDIQTFPLGQNTPSPSDGMKPSSTIGPRDPEKEKGHGVGVDLFLNDYLAVTSSLSLFPSEQTQLPWQNGNNGALDLNSSKLGGTVGIKMLFK